MNYSVMVIPKSLTGETFFIQLVIVEKCNEMNNGIHSCLDVDGIISCILTLGSPINSGNTNYYVGLKIICLELNNFRYHLNIAKYKLNVITKFITVFVLVLAIESY